MQQERHEERRSHVSHIRFNGGRPPTTPICVVTLILQLLSRASLENSLRGRGAQTVPRWTLGWSIFRVPRGTTHSAAAGPHSARTHTGSHMPEGRIVCSRLSWTR